MKKTCKTCINLCNKRGEVCKHYKGEVQEMLREIDKLLEDYIEFERYEIGGNMQLRKFEKKEDLIELGWGHEDVDIDDEDIEAIKNGEIIGWDDGEYTHRLVYKVKEE